MEAVVDVAVAEAGFLPRFLGAVCGGGGSACSAFRFLPGRFFVGTAAGGVTLEAVDVLGVEGSLL